MRRECLFLCVFLKNFQIFSAKHVTFSPGAFKFTLRRLILKDSHPHSCWGYQVNPQPAAPLGIHCDSITITASNAGSNVQIMCRLGNTAVFGLSKGNLNLNRNKEADEDSY